MVGAFEDFVGGQLPQGEGNLLIFEIRFVTNHHLVSGWGGGYIDSCITLTGRDYSVYISLRDSRNPSPFTDSGFAKKNKKTLWHPG